jgi:hypothetical protein
MLNTGGRDKVAMLVEKFLTGATPQADLEEFREVAKLPRYYSLHK